MSVTTEILKDRSVVCDVPQSRVVTPETMLGSPGAEEVSTLGDSVAKSAQQSFCYAFFVLTPSGILVLDGKMLPIDRSQFLLFGPPLHLEGVRSLTFQRQSSRHSRLDARLCNKSCLVFDVCTYLHRGVDARAAKEATMRCGNAEFWFSLHHSNGLTGQSAQGPKASRTTAKSRKARGQSSARRWGRWACPPTHQRVVPGLVFWTEEVEAAVMLVLPSPRSTSAFPWLCWTPCAVGGAQGGSGSNPPDWIPNCGVQGGSQVLVANTCDEAKDCRCTYQRHA